MIVRRLPGEKSRVPVDGTLRDFENHLLWIDVSVNHSPAIHPQADASVNSGIPAHTRCIPVLMLRVSKGCPGVSSVIGAEHAGRITRPAAGEPAQQIERRIAVAGSGHPEAQGVGPHYGPH